MATTPVKVWTKLLGASGSDQANALTTGLDGSIYVSGVTTNALDGQTNGGGIDAFLTKYSADGTKAWTKLLGTSGSENAYALTTGIDGSIYVSGVTTGALDGQTNGGSSDAFLTKYSADGTKAWTKLLGASALDQANALTTGLDGSIYVSGNTTGALDGQTYSGGTYDAYLTKYSADGTKAWTKLFGTSTAEVALALTTGLDGSIYVSGFTTGALDGQTNSGGYDAFLTKYSADGAKAWTKLLGTSGSELAYALTTGLDGSIYVTGETNGALDGQTNSGGYDAFLTKYSVDGTKAWTKLLGTSGNEFPTSLTTGLDGSIYIGGITYGPLDGQTNGGSGDAFLTKYSADGTKAWTKLLGTSGGDEAKALTTGLDGSIYVSGYTSGALDGQTNSGGIDAFLTKFQVDTAIYALSAGASSYSEGSTASFTLTTTNVTSGTSVPYTLSGISAADVSGGSLSGNAVVNSSGVATILVTLLNDSLTEGAETLTVTAGGATASTVVNDTSKMATYSLSASSSSFNEGSTATFTLNTTNVTSGTLVAYTLSGVSSADITGGLLTGSATVNSSGIATISVGIVADSLTEGAETLTVTTQSKTASATINDTSLSVSTGTETSPVKIWTRLLGTSGFDEGSALTTGLDGSIYVSGITNGALDGQTNSGSYDTFLTKYSADGTKAWTKLLGTSGNDFANALTTGIDGSIYVSGNTNGVALDGQSNSGIWDAFLTKYSSDGTKAWTKLLGSSDAEFPFALTTGLDGSIYVSGNTSGALDGQTNSGGADVFLTKYSTDGTKAWTKLLGTSGLDQANALTTGLDGSIYVSGATGGALDGQTNSGGSDVFLTKYSADGTKAWTKLLGTSVTDQANALTTGLDGSIYVSGYTNGAFDGQTNSGGYDAFLTKYSADGTKAWTKLLGSSSTDIAKALTTGLDDSIYVSGYTGGALDGQTNIGGQDAFLTRYSADGTKAWTKLLGTSGNENSLALTTRLDGSIYVSGITNGALDGQTNSGSYDAFLVKYQDPAFTVPAVVGTATPDTITNIAVSQNIDGGDGIDTLVYTSNAAGVVISKSGGSTLVINTATGEVDTLSNVERLKFADTSIALDINGTAGQAYRVYQAAFNRTPDNGGLKYWIGLMDGGYTLAGVASGFIASDEFKTLYGSNPTNELFVSKLYDNVLHRAPDTGGYNYWVGLLNTNKIDNISTLINFSESPENQAGVIGVIQNGIMLFN